MITSNLVLLCEVDSLGTGTHEAVFNVSSSFQPGIGGVYFDYASFASSNSIEEGTTLRIFANDTSSITFSPWWQLSDFPDVTEGVYTQGNGAELTFRFSGEPESLDVTYN